MIIIINQSSFINLVVLIVYLWSVNDRWSIIAVQFSVTNDSCFLNVVRCRQCLQTMVISNQRLLIRILIIADRLTCISFQLLMTIHRLIQLMVFVALSACTNDLLSIAKCRWSVIDNGLSHQWLFIGYRLQTACCARFFLVMRL